MKNKKTCLLVIIVILGILTTNAAIHYVKEGGTGSGTSWADASGNLQSVIDAATSLDKIFIAAGTYKPEEGTSFTLGGKVLSIYGAFAGNETSTTPPAIPDTLNHKTILEGNGNRVIYAYYKATAGDGKVDDNLTIQGCRIQGGIVAAPGAGLYIKTGVISYCTIAGNISTNNHGGGVWFEKCTLNNSVINGNTAGDSGGGLYSYVTVTLNDCDINNNTAQKGGGIFSHNVAKINKARMEYNKAFATGGGGGIYAEGSSDPSTIENCIINNNVSEGQAGGIFLGKKTKLINSTVKWNMAVYDGGGIRSDSENKVEIYQCIIEGNESTSGAGGGVVLNKSTMADCLIVGNTAKASGGGIRLTGASSSTGLKAYAFNNTIVNNIASSGGGISGNLNGVFQNCIIWNNNANGIINDVSGETKGTYSLYSEASTTDGNNNLNNNPLFKDPDNNDFRLSAITPAKDAGATVTGLPSGQILPKFDLAGENRVIGSAVDMGAYEYNPDTGIDFVENGQVKIWSSCNTLYVQSETKTVLTVYTISGVLYCKQTISANEVTVVNGLSTGIYIVKLDDGSPSCKVVIR